MKELYSVSASALLKYDKISWFRWRGRSENNVVAWNDVDDLVAYVTMDGQAFVFHPDCPSEMVSLHGDQFAPIRKVLWRPSFAGNPLLVTLDSNSQIVFWRCKQHRVNLWEVCGVIEPSSPLVAFNWTRNGQSLVCLRNDGHIAVYVVNLERNRSEPQSRQAAAKTIYEATPVRPDGDILGQVGFLHCGTVTPGRFDENSVAVTVVYEEKPHAIHIFHVFIPPLRQSTDLTTMDQNAGNLAGIADPSLMKRQFLVREFGNVALDPIVDGPVISCEPIPTSGSIFAIGEHGTLIRWAFSKPPASQAPANKEPGTDMWCQVARYNFRESRPVTAMTIPENGSFVLLGFLNRTVLVLDGMNLNVIEQWAPSEELNPELGQWESMNQDAESQCAPWNTELDLSALNSSEDPDSVVHNWLDVDPPEGLVYCSLESMFAGHGFFGLGVSPAACCVLGLTGKGDLRMMILQCSLKDSAQLASPLLQGMSRGIRRGGWDVLATICRVCKPAQIVSGGGANPNKPGSVEVESSMGDSDRLVKGLGNDRYASMMNGTMSNVEGFNGVGGAAESPRSQLPGDSSEAQNLVVNVAQVLVEKGGSRVDSLRLVMLSALDADTAAVAAARRLLEVAIDAIRLSAPEGVVETFSLIKSRPSASLKVAEEIEHIAAEICRRTKPGREHLVALPLADWVMLIVVTWLKRIAKVLSLSADGKVIGPEWKQACDMDPSSVIERTSIVKDGAFTRALCSTSIAAACLIALHETYYPEEAEAAQESSYPDSKVEADVRHCRFSLKECCDMVACMWDVTMGFESSAETPADKCGLVGQALQRHHFAAQAARKYGSKLEIQTAERVLGIRGSSCYAGFILSHTRLGTLDDLSSTSNMPNWCPYDCITGRPIPPWLPLRRCVFSGLLSVEVAVDGELPPWQARWALESPFGAPWVRVVSLDGSRFEMAPSLYPAKTNARAGSDLGMRPPANISTSTIPSPMVGMSPSMMMKQFSTQGFPGNGLPLIGGAQMAAAVTSELFRNPADKTASSLMQTNLIGMDGAGASFVNAAINSASGSVVQGNVSRIGMANRREPGVIGAASSSPSPGAMMEVTKGRETELDTLSQRSSMSARRSGSRGARGAMSNLASGGMVTDDGMQAARSALGARSNSMRSQASKMSKESRGGGARRGGVGSVGPGATMGAVLNAGGTKMGRSMDTPTSSPGVLEENVETDQHQQQQLPPQFARAPIQRLPEAVLGEQPQQSSVNKPMAAVPMQSQRAMQPPLPMTHQQRQLLLQQHLQQQQQQQHQHQQQQHKHQEQQQQQPASLGNMNVNAASLVAQPDHLMTNMMIAPSMDPAEMRRNLAAMSNPGMMNSMGHEFDPNNVKGLVNAGQSHVLHSMAHDTNQDDIRNASQRVYPGNHHSVQNKFGVNVGEDPNFSDNQYIHVSQPSPSLAMPGGGGAGRVHPNQIWNGFVHVRGSRSDLSVPCIAIAHEAKGHPRLFDASDWPLTLRCDPSKLKSSSSVWPNLNVEHALWYARFVPTTTSTDPEISSDRLVDLVKVMVMKKLAFELDCVPQGVLRGKLYLFGMELSNVGYSMLGVYVPLQTMNNRSLPQSVGSQPDILSVMEKLAGNG